MRDSISALRLSRPGGSSTRRNAYSMTRGRAKSTLSFLLTTQRESSKKKLNSSIFFLANLYYILYTGGMKFKRKRLSPHTKPNRKYKPKLDENGKPLKRGWNPDWGSPVVSFRISEEVLTKINALAKKHKVSRSTIIITLLEKYIMFEEKNDG
jgi:hypothetical protein